MSQFEIDHRPGTVPVAGGERLGVAAGSRKSHIDTKMGERKILSVPVHGIRELKPGLTRRLARDAGLDW